MVEGVTALLSGVVLLVLWIRLNERWREKERRRTAEAAEELERRFKEGTL